ncbi:MAG: AgmX/PglI C-terminal domain-containing protein [Bdellovibrionales bacterium]|nr:AgmX/PglI C-terminal domain-containing protein [Bdellovibrionales bacterium]
MGTLALQNRKKEVVRSFRYNGNALTLVMRQDQNRIEAMQSTAALDEQNIPYSIILETTVDEVRKKSISLGQYGYISFSDDLSKVAPSFQLAKDEEVLKRSLKMSAIVHVSLLVFLSLVSFIANKYFTEEKPQEVVTINIAPPPVEVAQPQKQVKTVQVSEKKIEKKKYTPKPVVAQKTTPKPQPKKVVIAKNIPVKKNIPMNNGPKIEQMGALSALSAVSKTNKSSLNLNGVGQAEGGKGSGGRGYGGHGAGGGGLGEGLNGGATGALPGKGLVASSPGTGSQASGAGGYGSAGNGGGRDAEGGAISFRGRSGGFMVPLAEEASVEAGLDRDQINAVVQKNMGQIIYCYEMGLQSKPNLKGRLTAEWTINSSGRVSTAKTAYSSVSDLQVESCIAGKIKNWKFPKPVGGVNVEVAYPFELRRATNMRVSQR